MREEILNVQDGTGVIVELWGTDEGFVSKPNGDIILFDNIKVAKVYMINKLGITNPYNYKLYFRISDRDIDIDELMYDKDSKYYIYNSNGEIIYIKESCTTRVNQIGYFIFNDGDQPHIIDRQEGRAIEQRLLTNVKKVAADYQRYFDCNPSIEGITIDDNMHCTLTIKGTTAAIRICTNGQLVQLNQKRKDDGTRCIPFEKVDKYNTLFTYITIDDAEPEPEQFKGYEKAKALQEIIVEYLKDYYPEDSPRYHRVTFNGDLYL